MSLREPTKLQAAPGDSRILTLLKIGSIRFSAFYFAPFYAAVVLCGRGSVAWLVAGALFCLGVCLGIELANRYADRIEDRVNRPERTAMCDRVGYRTIGLVAITIFALLVPIGLTWFVLYFNVALFSVQAAVWLVALNYSYGLRFKARRRLSLLVLGCTFVLPFLVAWTMFRALRELPPMLPFVPLFVLSVAGVKDITDVAGDRLRGYRSLMVDLIRRGPLVLLLWLAVPYLYVVLMVATGLAPLRFLALLAFAPGSLALALLLREARGEETQAVREWMYHLWFTVLLVSLWLLAPDLELLAVLAGTAAFWVLATRRLHWTVGLRADQLATASSVLARALRLGPTVSVGTE